ncbi:hypothetical protein GCM10022236_20330 [Microlunatus ginsengisoli]|uniref:Extracellular solute-binding protein n=1 Tax=Microlunatus ginsengisoli TaxID=363863 RepID=A0ABP6ZSY1_9ACTN
MSTGTPLSPLTGSPLSRRRLLGVGAAIAGAAVGSGVLSACGGSPRPTAASSSKSAPALVKPNGKVTLTLWTWAWPEAPADAELQKAFETAVPEVTLSVKKFPYPDYTTALRTGVPNGTAGDVLHLQTGSMIKQYAQYLAPLESYTAEAFGEDWRSQFLSGSVEEIEASKVGLVALPQQFSVGGVMFANNKLLSSVGGALPTSYDQYLALSPKLAPKNAVAASWGAKDDWPNTDYLVQFASQWSPGIVAKAEAGEASFADDAIVQAMKFMQRTLKDKLWNAAPFATTAFPDAYNLFFNGKAASASLGTWGVGALYEGSRLDDWGAFLWPTLPDANPDPWLPAANPEMASDTSKSPVRPWRTVNVATAMRSGLDPDKQWAAWQFVRWSCSKEGQQAGAKIYSPSRVDVKPEGLNERWNALYDWQNSLSKFAERREFDYPETRTAIQTAISACCVNNADPATELKRVDAAAERARTR